MRRYVDNSKDAQRLLATPTSIFTTLISDLQHARATIDMEFYIFEVDRIGGVVADILCRKARQGLSVRLVIDGFGSRSMSRALHRRMRSSGVQIVVTSAISLRRNHRKMVIIDGVIAYVGGANIADRYVVGNDLGVWHDVMMRFTGDGVKLLAKIFERDFCRRDSGAIVVSPSDFAPMIYWSDSVGGVSMSLLFDEVASSAQSELVLVTPYFLATPRVLKTLTRVRSRGVRVVVIVPKRCDVWVVDELMRHSISEAMACGINVEVVCKDFVHAKMAFVDSRRVVLGSANIDALSLGINREIMISTYDRGVCNSARLFINHLRSIAVSASGLDMKSHIPRFVARMLSPMM